MKMFGRLTKDDRINLTGLGIAVRMNNSEMLSKIAWRLSNKAENTITRPQLAEKLGTRIESLGSGNMSVEDMIKFFQEVGLELNDNVLNYLRGSITLGDQLTEVDAKNSLLAMSVRVGLKHPVQLLKVLKLEEISIRDLAKVAWKQFISSKMSKSLSETASANMCLGFYSNSLKFGLLSSRAGGFRRRNVLRFLWKRGGLASFGHIISNSCLTIWKRA